MNAVIPYHRGVLTQRGKGIGGVFSSLFRNLLPIGKAFVRSSPKIIKNTVKKSFRKEIKKISKESCNKYCKEFVRVRRYQQNIKEDHRRFKKKKYQVL